MNYCATKSIKCECANPYGWCMVTACKHIGIAQMYGCNSVRLNKIQEEVNTRNKDVLIFPHTIGKVTFYTKKELIDWVLMQQDEDYGIGNNA